MTQIKSVAPISGEDTNALPVKDIGPAIARAYASGKTAVIHVAIDPTVNSEESTRPQFASVGSAYTHSVLGSPPSG